MVSIWWIIWAFLIGGYAGMLLISLVVIARKVKATG
jgi:RsiW-degrading membrane proteinase PrsW (M82 family)